MVRSVTANNVKPHSIDDKAGTISDLLCPLAKVNSGNGNYKCLSFVYKGVHVVTARQWEERRRTYVVRRYHRYVLIHVCKMTNCYSWR